jgi:uncharacterized repeat protein (TIGR01451 family)
VRYPHLFVVTIFILGFACHAQQLDPPTTLRPQAKSAARRANTPDTRRVLETYKKLPLIFESNRGQASGEVRFVARGRGYSLYLTSAKAVLYLNPSSQAGDNRSEHKPAPRPARVEMTLVGANRKQTLVGFDELPGRVNYLLGNDPKSWHTNIPAFEKVRYQNAYPGIDLIYRGNQRQLEFDFALAAGADPNRIRISFEGIDDMHTDDEGNLVLSTQGGLVQLQRPLIYQKINGMKQPVSGGYLLSTNDGEVALQVGPYDTSKPLVIDPALVYSTYLGGNGNESATGIAVDAQGNAYVTGFSGSSNFPLTSAPSAPFDSGLGGSQDAFVTKFDLMGKLVYSTYLGGSSGDSAGGIAVDADGNAYVTGRTTSIDFPIKNAFQPTFQPGGVFKSSNAGNSWAPSGLSDVSIIDALAINPQNHSTIYAGTTDGVFKTIDSAGHWNATSLTSFVNSNALIVDPNNPSTVYAGTLLSGIFKSTDSGATWDGVSNGLPSSFGTFNQVACLTIDPQHSLTLYACITGSGIFKSTDGGASWNATSFPNTPNAFFIAVDPVTSATVYVGTGQGLFQSLDGGTTWNATSLKNVINAIVISPAVHTTLYAATDAGVFVSTDSGATWNATGLNTNVNVLVADPVNLGTLYASTGAVFKSTDSGATWTSINSGITQPVNALAIDVTSAATPAILYAGTFGSSSDVFVTELNSTGSDILYSTYFGGSSDEQATGITIDASRNVYITGNTDSRDLPTTPGAFEASFRHVFVAKFNPSLSGASSLVYSTFLGGTLNAFNDRSFAIAVDTSGDAYVTGRTNATDFPATASAYASTCGTDANCNGHLFDAFVTEINSSGSALVYSTYLGGSGDDQGNGIAVDGAGDIYVAGGTTSADFPTLNAFQTALSGGRDAFLAKLNPGASGATSLVYSTFVGGKNDDYGSAVAVDSGGNAYLTGYTTSTDFPTANAVQASMNPGTCLPACSDAFVTMLNTGATGPASLVFSTFLGGSANDYGSAIAVDNAGEVYVAGTTEQALPSFPGFPTTAGAFQGSYGGGIDDAFVAKISVRGLSLTMTATPTQPMFGGLVTYTITASDIGPDAFTGVKVTDAVPAGMTFLSASGSCTGTSTITCDLGTIAGNSSANMTILVAASTPGQFSNTATATANEPIPNPSAATATAVVTVNSNSDLSISMSASPSLVAVSGVYPDGGQLTYTIVVTNNGPDPASGVTVTDNYPLYFTFTSPVTVTQGTCAFTNPQRLTLTCNLGALASGASATITLVGMVSYQTLAFQNVITNTASVSGAFVSDSNSANNTASASATATTRVSDIAVIKSGPGTVPAAGSLTYNILVTNNGPDAAGNVIMLDTLDLSSLIFVSAIPQGTCTFKVDTVECDLGVVNRGASVPITLQVTTQPSVSVGATINNTARAGFFDLGGADPDPNSNNNTSSVATSVVTPTADLFITKTPSANPATVGDSLSYVFTVGNSGPNSAPGVIMSDQLPAEVSLVSVSPSQGTCNLAITCRLGTIAPNATATVTIVVTPTKSGHISNTATVFADVVDSNTTNNSATQTTDFVFTSSAFASWEMAHCFPFNLSAAAPFPPRILNVAYLPFKFSDAGNTLTTSQITTRIRYIRDYYFQQSMCSVLVNPVLITDPTSADGWMTFPKTLASYSIPPATSDPSGQLLSFMQLWIDAFDTASVKQPALLLGQQAKFFDAVFVIETIPRSTARGRALMMRPLADNPLIMGLDQALKGGIIGTIGAAITTLGPLAFLLPGVNASNIATLLTLPELFEQGSVVISDQDDNVTWAHELGHGLFAWWDYYGDTGNFFNRGDIEAAVPTPSNTPMLSWGIMGGGQGTTPGTPAFIEGAVPPYPVNSFDKVIAGWLNYSDICSNCFGNYPLVALKDLPFGGSILRYETPRDTIGNPTSKVASYIFEYREPPDDIPITPESMGEPVNGPAFGQTGVVMYQKRDVHSVLGVPTYNPYCGPAHGFTQDAIGVLIGFEFSSCIEKVNNPDRGTFTLMPGGSFVDDVINTTFVLSSDVSNPVLTIHDTAASRTVIQMEYQLDLPGVLVDLQPDSLHANLERIDLHVVAPGGAHVGPNYTTGGFDFGIAGARAGGIGTPVQWISIPDNVQASYTIDASQAMAAVQALGIQTPTVSVTASIFRYDANGTVGKVTDPIHLTLNLTQPTTGQISVPLGANLGIIHDNAPPVVMPPAGIVIFATEAGGSRANASTQLATFLAGATAVDDVDPFPSLLLPQVAGADVSLSTLFPLGTTVVTFRFQDASGKIGSATSTVTVAPHGRAFVPNTGSSTVSVIDTLYAKNTIVATVPVGSFPVAAAVTANGAQAYIVNAGSKSVSIINAGDNSVAKTLAVGQNPVAVAITPSGTSAYVANAESNSVSVIDTASQSVVKTIPVGDDPLFVAIRPDGGALYVANAGDSSVSIINPATNTVTRTIKVGNHPVAVVILPNGSTAYVANSGSNSVSVIDTSSNTVLRTVSVGWLPTSMAITPSGTAVYVTNSGSKSVSVISTASNTVTNTVTVGNVPTAIVITGSEAYVANTASRSVSVINTATNTVATTIPAGTSPASEAVTADGKVVYVVDAIANSVLAIDTTSKNVIAKVPVGVVPTKVVIGP